MYQCIRFSKLQTSFESSHNFQVCIFECEFFSVRGRREQKRSERCLSISSENSSLSIESFQQKCAFISEKGYSGNLDESDQE